MSETTKRIEEIIKKHLLDSSCAICQYCRHDEQGGYMGFCIKNNCYLKTLSDRCCEHFYTEEEQPDFINDLIKELATHLHQEVLKGKIEEVKKMPHTLRGIALRLAGLQRQVDEG